MQTWERRLRSTHTSFRNRSVIRWSVLQTVQLEQKFQMEHEQSLRVLI
jgi:hypothetical protein